MAPSKFEFEEEAMILARWTHCLIFLAAMIPGCGGSADGLAPPEMVEVEVEVSGSEDRNGDWRGLTGDFGDECVVDCDGRECGPDGCNGSCGLCPSGFACGPAGLCVPAEPDPGSCAAGGCFNTCDFTDDECLESCLIKLDNMSQSNGWELQACALDSCWHCVSEDGDTATGEFSSMAFICFADCLRSTCAEPYTECLTGNGGCWTLGGCVKGCPESDSACNMTCFSKATYLSQGAFLDLMTCLFDACPFGGRGCRQESMRGDNCHSLLQACIKQ